MLDELSRESSFEESIFRLMQEGAGRHTEDADNPCGSTVIPFRATNKQIDIINMLLGKLGVREKCGYDSLTEEEARDFTGFLDKELFKRRTKERLDKQRGLC